MYKGKIYIEDERIVDYGYTGIEEEADESFDNLHFLATIRITSMSRGRSAANFTVIIGEGEETPKLLRGKRCTMFMRDLLDVIEREGIRAGGEVAGGFCFCKRGRNYGIQLYKGGS